VTRTDHPETDGPDTVHTDGPGREPRTARGQTLTQFGLEMTIGVIIAMLLVLVGWASSNAIRFVYGGY